jgi:acyl-CoA synthetase (AMP-forming)/AMP-acid ligase II
MNPEAPGSKHRGVNLLNEPAALTRLLESGLRQRPGQPAIVFEGRAYTYEALERRVSALAARFSAFGLAGERVGLTLPNSIDLVPDIRREDFAALRGVYTGGDVVPPARPATRFLPGIIS